ncbi:hypothetical protein [Bacillus sp. REN10]|uniref:hypothetical protein n=1 Tax=Bacillus sp. REN10 TaxID=2782541 RepID=UPI00193BAA22|nr:hypothetical protein [Bacillus sp. REN10]
MGRHCGGHHEEAGNNHHSHKHSHKQPKASFVDFEFYTLEPNISISNRFELPANVQTPVASVTLDEVKKGNLVWLNGVFGLDNDSNNVRTVLMRIYKGSPAVFIPGQEIYLAVIEIDDEGDDDQVVEPLAHVDEIDSNEDNLTYTVTLQPSGDDVFLNGPVTFTAVLIKK